MFIKRRNVISFRNALKFTCKESAIFKKMSGGYVPGPPLKRRRDGEGSEEGGEREEVLCPGKRRVKSVDSVPIYDLVVFFLTEM